MSSFSSEYCQRILSSHEERRRFFNRFLFGLDSLYLTNILSYNHGIKQKNILLKKNIHLAEIISWNQVISEMAFSLTNQRYKLVQKINRILFSVFNIKDYINYVSSIDINKYQTKNNILCFLNDKIHEEKKFGYSIYGPHRDKFFFNNPLNKDISYSSSGEVKIFFFFVFLSYCDFFYSLRGEYPLLLIDDFDTALDDYNKDKFKEVNANMQMICSAVKNNSFFDFSFSINKGAF